MSNKESHPASKSANELDLTSAVEHFIQQGGVIHVVPAGESGELVNEAPTSRPDTELEDERLKKLEQFKSLVAKGAGVSALQYSLRMNKRDLRRMAGENGLKISYSRPIRRSRNEKARTTETVDDELAGHAMHYSSLGFSALEIAQKLNLSVRQVWEIGRDYRVEFKHAGEQHEFDTPTEE
ncbi:hypothetical protein [Pseudomonas sp. NA-150]|uniref:hypothetical protein n=1 Tax=Pseudomonas sp. NA-150 TaxID=3367525 RepID=UPI0037CA23A6